jgi:hypothetical protein
MKQYTFYIDDGKAVRRAIGGGEINSFAGSISNPAVNVQSQGGVVIVTYEDGKVEEYPYPGQGGGGIRTLVNGRARKQYQSSSDQANPSYSDDARSSEESIIKGLLSLILLVIIVCIFHSPMGWLLSKTHSLTLIQGIDASMSSLRGWLSVTLIWVCFCMLFFGLYTLLTKKLPKLFLSSLLLTICSAVFVWHSLSAIAENKLSETHQAVLPTLSEDSNGQTQIYETVESTKDRRSLNQYEPPVKTPQLPSVDVRVQNQQPAERATPKFSDPPSDSSKNQTAGAAKLTVRNSPSKQTPIEIEDTRGRKIQAEVLALTTTTVLVRKDDGNVYDIALSSLSEASRQNISDWRDSRRSMLQQNGSKK